MNLKLLVLVSSDWAELIEQNCLSRCGGQWSVLLKIIYRSPMGRSISVAAAASFFWLLLLLKPYQTRKDSFLFDCNCSIDFIHFVIKPWNFNDTNENQGECGDWIRWTHFSLNLLRKLTSSDVSMSTLWCEKEQPLFHKTLYANFLSGIEFQTNWLVHVFLPSELVVGNR